MFLIYIVLGVATGVDVKINTTIPPFYKFEECNNNTTPDADRSFIIECVSGYLLMQKIYRDYKGHRLRRKPLGYRRLVNHCKQNYCHQIRKGLEADDSLGIDATRNPSTDNIIVSPDKDMRQIPGVLWNMTDDVEEITKEDGDRWHLIQSMAGDPTDGYPGCPGIGVKRATELLNKHGNKWEAICQAYKERGLSDDDALLNARLAKILQHTDYDYDRKEPILWTPVL